MAAHPPVRMPSSEWAGKDRPVYFRSPSSQLRYQAISKNPFARDAIETTPRGAGSPIPSTRASTVPSSESSAGSSTNPFASPYDASAPYTQAAARSVNTSIQAAEAPASSANASPPVPEGWAPPIAESPVSPPGRSSEPKDTKARSVRNSVGSAIESVSETVKPYLPESIAAYLPASNAEKQQETSSGPGIGVGALPSDVSETSVTNLPEERAMKSRQNAFYQKCGKRDTHAKTANNQSTSPRTMYNSAKNYFRQSLGAYLPGDAPPSSQLPSKETPGGSAVGVGSLPGNISEVSVAKLPEERRLEDMPSHESDHELLGKSGGVGALPGGPNESRVAMLPEERIHPQYDAGPTAMGYDGATGMAVGLGSIKHGEGYRSSANHPLTTERVHEGDPLPRRVPGAVDQEAYKTGTEEGAGAAQPASGAAAAGVGTGVAVVGATAAAHHPSSNQKGYARLGGTAGHPDVRLDPGYHPAELHPLDPKFKQEGSKVPSSSHPASSSPDTNAGNTNRHSSVSAESEGHSSTSSEERRKIGFMKKMKGEVKVISGKLSHNEKKIEEGKQMMGK